MADVSLLPCPLCDGTEDKPFTYEDWPDWYVECGQCECRTGSYQSEDEAIVAWNTRALTHKPAVSDEQVLKHHRYRSLWEDFQTVEKDLRACALLVGHHYNSLRPVAPAVEAAISNKPAVSEEDLSRIGEIAEGAVMSELSWPEIGERIIAALTTETP